MCQVKRSPKRISLQDTSNLDVSLKDISYILGLAFCLLAICLSYNPKKRYDIEDQTLQTLGQKLAGKMPELVDYACNAYADKIVQIELLMLQTSDEDLKKSLEEVKTQLTMVGRALYFKKADILTNLSLLVGRTGVKGRHGTRHETDIKKA